MTWFALNGVVVALGLFVVAACLRPGAAGRAMLLIPFVLGSYITLNTLRKATCSWP